MSEHRLNAFELGILADVWDQLDVVTRSHAVCCECLLCEARAWCSYDSIENVVKDVTFDNDLQPQWSAEDILRQEG